MDGTQYFGARGDGFEFVLVVEGRVVGVQWVAGTGIADA